MHSLGVVSALVGSSLGVVSALIGCCEYTQREFSGHSYSAGYVSTLLALQPHLVGVEITLTHNYVYICTQKM